MLLRRFVLRLLVCGVAACHTGAGSTPETKTAAHEVRLASSESSPPPSAEPARDTAPGVASTPTSAELAQQFGAAPSLATLKGEASYYADYFAGRRTASGERYEPSAFTAAHRKLPFGSVVRVRRIDSGETVYVRITDRGPFGRGRRIIDLSKAAALSLGMLRAGVADVVVEVVKYGPDGD